MLVPTRSSPTARPTASKNVSVSFVAAKAEIEQEANRAREELRGQVSAIAIASAEKILMREIDGKAHDDILGKLAQEL